MQGREMRGNGGLRHAAAPIDLTRADAMRQRQFLIREMLLRLLQPLENLAAKGVGEGLVNCVDVHFVAQTSDDSCMLPCTESSQNEVYIVNVRYASCVHARSL